MRTWCVLPILLLLLLLLTGCQTTGSLGGTSWTVIEVLSSEETDIVDMDVDFGTDGMVTTTLTRADGSRDTSRRQYSVHDALISVRRPEGDLHVLHRIEGDDLFLTAESFQVRLLRMN